MSDSSSVCTAEPPVLFQPQRGSGERRTVLASIAAPVFFIQAGDLSN
jgi:hypothetical protein